MTHTNNAHSQGWNFEHTYAELPAVFHSVAAPTPVASPQLVIFNTTLAAELGLNSSAFSAHASAALFSGNQIPEGGKPLAQAYAGHQFGSFTLLGDGRAILLGEHVCPHGRRIDVQLKGAGPTRYSRRGDGRAALKPMLREYIISEAIHALGIPTTRSLAVVTTGEQVFREEPLTGAVLTRVAESHLRVGTFEFARSQGQPADLQALIEYALIRHYPEGFAHENPTLALLESVIARQAQLVARWMQVGFIHGVMNTDNMTISGETIDYGPCAFMDTYAPSTVFSSIDRDGRYAYANQPHIALWNLERFAEAVLPFLHEEEDKAVELAQDALETFATHYNDAWLNGMRHKLGLLDAQDTDTALITQLLGLMHTHKVDYTTTLRALAHFDTAMPESPLFSSPEFSAWKKRWDERRDGQHKSASEIRTLMNATNPSVIARNHRVEEALSAADAGDLTAMEKLLDVLRTPFDDSPTHSEYAVPPGPNWVGYRTFCGT